MKKLNLVSIIFFLSLGLSAQENKSEYGTIFNKKSGEKVSHGGYGAFNMGYSTIDGKSALVTGARGAWVIDHKIALGIAGNGFFNNVQKSDNNLDYYLAGGYGGFYFEPIVKHNSSIHLSFPIIIGGGGVTTVPYYWDSYHWDTYYPVDAFFVFEPGVEIEFNVVNFFRMSIGATYRFTNGIIMSYSSSGSGKYDIPKEALNSFSFYMNFKFGKF